MLKVSEQDVKELQALGNGATKFIPAADGGVWRLSYLWGKLRIDKFGEAVKIPLSARRGGGGDIPAGTTD